MQCIETHPGVAQIWHLEAGAYCGPLSHIVAWKRTSKLLLLRMSQLLGWRQKDVLHVLRTHFATGSSCPALKLHHSCAGYILSVQNPWALIAACVCLAASYLWYRTRHSIAHGSSELHGRAVSNCNGRSEAAFNIALFKTRILCVVCL